jgi:hypothetical protein
MLISVGTSAAEMRRKISDEGVLKSLQDLKNLVESNGMLFSDLFPNIRGLTGSLDILGKNAEANAAIFERLNDTLGVTQTAFEETANTAESKLTVALAKTQVEMVKMGEQLVPLKVWWVNLKLEAVTAMSAIVGAGSKFFNFMADIGKKIGGIGVATDAMGGSFQTSLERIRTITNKIVPDMVGDVVGEYQNMSDKTSEILDEMAGRASKEYARIAESVISGALKMWESSPAGKELDLVNKIKVAQAELQKGTTGYVDELKYAVKEWQNQLEAINTAKTAVTEMVDSWETIRVDRWNKMMDTVGNRITTLFGTTMPGKIASMKESIQEVMGYMIETFADLQVPETEKAFSQMEVIAKTHLGQTMEGIKTFIKSAEVVMGPISEGEYFEKQIVALGLLAKELEGLKIEVPLIEKSMIEAMKSSISSFRGMLQDSEGEIASGFRSISNTFRDVIGKTKEGLDFIADGIRRTGKAFIDRMQGSFYGLKIKDIAAGNRQEEATLNWDVLKEAGKNFKGRWQRHIVSAGVIIRESGKSVGAAIREMIKGDGGGAALGTLLSRLGPGAAAAGEAIGAMVSKAWEWVKSTDAAQSMIERFKNSFKESLEPIINRIGIPLEKFALGLESLGDSLGGLFGTGERLGNMFEQMGRRMAALGGVIDWIAGGLQRNQLQGLVSASIIAWENASTAATPFDSTGGSVGVDGGGGGISVRQPQTINVYNYFYAPVIATGGASGIQELSVLVGETVQMYLDGGGTITTTFQGATV